MQFNNEFRFDRFSSPNCGQRQHGRDAQPDAVTGGLPVYPKRHPRQHDDQNARHINLHNAPAVYINIVIAQTAHQQFRTKNPALT